MTVLIRPARIRSTQLDLYRPNGPAPERLATTIARLSALVGPEHVGAPRVVDSWKEELMAIEPPMVEPAPRPATRGSRLQTTFGQQVTLAIRRFRPPRDVEVLIGPTGPAALRGKETTARILVAAGPYRMSGEWWAGGGFWSRVLGCFTLPTARSTASIRIAKPAGGISMATTTRPDLARRDPIWLAFSPQRAQRTQRSDRERRRSDRTRSQPFLFFVPTL